MNKSKNDCERVLEMINKIEDEFLMEQENIDIAMSSENSDQNQV